MPATVGNGLYFYGPYIQVADHSDLNFGTGPFSIDAWIYYVPVSPVPPGSGPVIAPIVDKFDPATNKGYAFFLYIDTTGTHLRFRTWDGTNFSVAGFPVPGIPPLTWTHLAVTVDRPGPGVSIYINGTAGVTQAPAAPGNIDNSVPLWMGKSRLHTLLNAGFRETAIDELELFNRTLTPKEVQDIYNAGPAGKCKPTCVSPPLRTINLNTGYDQWASPPVLIPVGGLDNEWRVIVDPDNPPPTAPIANGRPANVLDGSFWLQYNPYPSSRWISINSAAGLGLWTTPSYDFSFYFTLPPGFSSPQLTMKLNADDHITQVTLNGNSLFTGSGGIFINPPLVVSSNTPGFFNSGPNVNVLTVTFQNTVSGSIRGLVVEGTVTYEDCCRQPIKDIPGLTSITFWESTGALTPFTFSPSGPELTIKLISLNSSNNDFQGVPGAEFYDVFYSNWDGTFNLNGEFVTIEAVFNVGAPSGGGLNIARVDFNGTGQYANSVASFVALGNNALPADVGKAVDGNPLTDTTMGNTIGQTQRLRVTVGFPCPCVQAPSGIAHWWPFDETAGTLAYDITGGRNGDTKPGAISITGPTSVVGKVNGAFEFNGSSTFVEVPDSPGTLSFGNPGQEFSIDAWIKANPGDAAGVRPIVDKRVESGGRVAGYALYLRDGKLSFQLADGIGSSNICDVNPSSPSAATSCTNYESTANVADGQWHLVAVTVKRTGASPQVKLYVGGVLTPVFTGPTRIHANNNASLLIGAGYPIVITKPYFKGAIDELEIFNRVLTPQEVQGIYQAGAAGKCTCSPLVLDISTGTAGIGNPDPRWTLVAAPTGSGSAFGVAKDSSWVAPPPVSNWISFTTGLAPAGPPGVYTYATQFNVPLTVYQNPQMTLQFASDDVAHPSLLAGIVGRPLLNGIPQTPTQLASAPFQVLYPTSPATITTGFATSLSGTNTLAFEVHNLPPGYSPTGLLVRGRVTADCKPTPKPTADLGDAPDSTNNHNNAPMTAYPSVTANFPTVFSSDPTKPGPRHLNPKGLAWLGADVTFENEADTGPDADPTNNLDFSVSPPAPDKDGKDDGVALPLVLPACAQIAFKYTVTGTVSAGNPMYLNVWFDFNRDGDWEDIQKCPLGPTITGGASDWSVQNVVVTVPGTFTTPLFTVWNPSPADPMWMRITLSEQPAPPGTAGSNPDGRGPASEYKYGETEDYLVRSQPHSRICGTKFNDLNGNGVQDPGEPGLPNWVITATGPNGIVTAVTDLNGNYCIAVPSPGTYTITEQPQTGWTPTTPTTQPVTVPPSAVNVFFGNKQAGMCDRTIEKTVSPNPGPSGGTVTITLTVTNVGTAPCPVVAGINVADPQPAGLTFQSPVSANNPGWSCFISGPSGTWPGGVTCTATSPLLPGPTNAVTITFTATVTAPPGSTIQNCAEVTNVGDADGTNNNSCVTIQVYPCAPAPPDMAAWWTFNETSGTIANDLAGVPNNGTHVNGPTPIPGKVSGALHFDGVDDYVTVLNHAELNFGQGDLSIDAWIRTTGTTDILPIVDKREVVGNVPQGYTLFLYNGSLAFQLADAVGSGFTNYISSASVADGQWHQVAVTVQRTGGAPNLTLYVDGVSVLTNSSPRIGSVTNTAPLWIGRRHPMPGAQAARYFAGDIDELEIFNRALTVQEVRAIFNAGPAGKCK